MARKQLIRVKRGRDFYTCFPRKREWVRRTRCGSHIRSHHGDEEFRTTARDQIRERPVDNGDPGTIQIRCEPLALILIGSRSLR